MNTVVLIRFGAYCQNLYNMKPDFRIQLIGVNMPHCISVLLEYPIIESIVFDEIACVENNLVYRAWVGYCKGNNTLYYQEYKEAKPKSEPTAKYTSEYIADRRKEMQAEERVNNEAGWISLEEFYELLDAIEQRNSMIAKLIEVGNDLDFIADQHDLTQRWIALASAWKAASL